jgi:D-alanine transfer protein
MIRRAIARPRTPHLLSALIACALPFAILCGGRLLAIYLERKTIHATAPRDFFIKNQGLALQRAAARVPNILLLYGSSELIDPIPNRASDFFSNAPTGFQVCPVGKAGTTSLIILQKLAALGSELRGRKVVISLSPSSFFTRAVNPDAYAANFSLPAASGILFGDALDVDLKTEIAKRMLQFPDTLAKSALLQRAAVSLASGRPFDRVILTALWPLGKLQNTLLDLQDHFEVLVYILGGGRGMPRRKLEGTSREAWTRRDQTVPTIEPPGAIGSDRDAVFRARMAVAPEWIDLELLFRTLTELRAQALIISMPIDATFSLTAGVSRSGRRVYYDKMNQLAQQYHFQLIEFEDHDADPAFLIAHREHPTPQGWMHYNRALEDFFNNAKRD